MVPLTAQNNDQRDGIFRLLLPAEEPAPPGLLVLNVQGHRWMLTQERTPDAADTPKYVCVSYAWGTGKVANPLNEDFSMSDRALPAFASAVAARSLIEAETGVPQPAAIWFDAGCVPFENPARDRCLKTMGAIYGNAAYVIAVLSTASCAVLEQIRQSGRVEENALRGLEDDIWVARAWTYQEIVNSRTIYFTCEGDSGTPIRGDTFLNAVGKAIADFKNAHGFDSFGMRKAFPRLDSLEDVVADWLTAAYIERSAYQIMAAMDRRVSEQPDDRFYAMIGAITATPWQSSEPELVSAAEYFMRVCEAKDDYSFIYAIAPRSTVPGRCWRPVAGPLHPILAWHSAGERQSGTIYPTHLQLNNMYSATLGALDAPARQFVATFLQDDAASTGNMPALILRRLRDAGFQGCGEFLELEGGYFFPHEPVIEVNDLFAVIATEVRWVFGAPGLLVRDHGQDIHHCYGVGVFVGLVPQSGRSINIGKAS